MRRHPSAAFESLADMAKSPLSRAEGLRPYKVRLLDRTFFALASGRSQATSAVLAMLRQQAKTEGLSIADMMEAMAKG